MAYYEQKKFQRKAGRAPKAKQLLTAKLRGKETGLGAIDALMKGSGYNYTTRRAYLKQLRERAEKKLPGPKGKLPNPRTVLGEARKLAKKWKTQGYSKAQIIEMLMEHVGKEAARRLVNNPRGLSTTDIEKFPARYRSDISGQMAGMRPAPRTPQFGPLFSSVRVKKLKLAGGGAARQVQKLNKGLRTKDSGLRKQNAPHQRVWIIQAKKGRSDWYQVGRVEGHIMREALHLYAYLSSYVDKLRAVPETQAQRDYEAGRGQKPNPDIKCERCGQRYAIDSYCPICRAENPESAYAVAARKGYPYIRGEGKVALNGYTWLSRFTKAADGKGPALYVGWDEKKRRWIVKTEAAKRNPSLRALSQTFQGKASGAVSQFKASNSAPADLARTGKLVFIKLVGGGQVRVPGAMVAMDKTGRLWLVGLHVPMFTRKAKLGELLDFGEMDQLCYLTSKKHIENGQATEYVHSFGEDGGRRPHLLVDSEGMPILRGGDYKIKSEGIVN